jgi:sarcosine oxidase delta subunit
LFDEGMSSARAGYDFEETVLALVRTAFAQLSGDPGRREIYLWFTADGVLATSADGHADYARRALPSPATPEDIVTQALAQFGWIAVTVRPDGGMLVRHDGRKLAQLAAERLCDWLTERGDRGSLARRAVHIEGRWVEVADDTVTHVITAIADLAIITRSQRRPWTIEQLPLDAIEDPRLLELLRIHGETPDKIIHRAAAIGAFTTSGVLRVDGEDVISLHAPTAFALDHQAIEGRNVLARPDADYALMIKERVLRTKREGPLYFDLIGSIGNRFVRYLSLGLPEAGPGRRVLTSAVLLDDK